MKVSNNDDSIVATSDWMWMTLMRLNRKADAAKVLERITPKMDILENAAYHRRLLMYKGLEKPEALLDTASPRPDADRHAGLRRRRTTTSSPATPPRRARFREDHLGRRLERVRLHRRRSRSAADEVAPKSCQIGARKRNQISARSRATRSEDHAFSRGSSLAAGLVANVCQSGAESASRARSPASARRFSSG